jgi:hypothetical protein
VQYLRLCARSTADQELADLRFPLVAGAQRLWLDATLRSQLMILAIADTPKDAIARHLDVDPAVIAATESLFFDVRDALQATSWIHVTVVMRLLKEGDKELAAKVKTAYAGGPEVAKALCDAAIQIPKDAADRLFAQEMLLHAKFAAVTEFPLTSEQSIEFMKLFWDYKLQSQKLQLRKEAFAHRCQEDVSRYELRKQRLALAAARQGIDLFRQPGVKADAPATPPPVSASQGGTPRCGRPAVKVAG